MVIAATPLTPTTNTQTTYYSDYHFTREGSPYIIDGNVYFRYGTLILDPGVVIKFVSATSSLDTTTDRSLAIYSSLTNKTYLIETVLGDDSNDLSLQSAALLLRKKLKTLNGLVVPGITTRQGAVLIGY